MAADSAAKRAKLITLLNVSAARDSSKRKAAGQDWHEIARQVKREKLAASAAAQQTETSNELVETNEEDVDTAVAQEAVAAGDEEEDEKSGGPWIGIDRQQIAHTC